MGKPAAMTVKVLAAPGDQSDAKSKGTGMNRPCSVEELLDTDKKKIGGRGRNKGEHKTSQDGLGLTNSKGGVGARIGEHRRPVARGGKGGEKWSGWEKR